MDQQMLTMAFGAMVAVAGIVIFIFKQQEPGTNTVQILGFEVTLSTPGLVIFVVGSGIFVLPLLLQETADPISPPAPQPTASTQPTASSQPPASMQPPVVDIPEVEDQDCIAWIFGGECTR